MKLNSIFGPYATQLQVIIDNSANRFAPLWYPKYFDFAPVQQDLSFKSIIGSRRLEAAASVVDRESSAPLRSRPGTATLQGEVPAIKEKMKMQESDYRNWLTLQNLNVSDEIKRAQMLDFIFNDTQTVGNAAHKRVDIMALEAVSTGKISMSLEWNPDGVILEDPLDLMMPEGNRSQASVSWDNPATATPITDFENKVEAGKAKGVTFAKALMSRSLWLKFKKSKEVIDTLQAYYYGPKPGSGFNPVAVTTLDKVNEFLDAEKLPLIELVDETIGIEKDGIIRPINPFSQDNVSFIPATKLGLIRNALAIEQIQPVDNVNYGMFNRALISKWSENDPFGEWTAVELNACPSLEAIDSIFLLEAIH